MMTRNEIIAVIQASPLSDRDLSAIIAAATQKMIAESLIGSGMDLLAQIVSVDEAADD